MIALHEVINDIEDEIKHAGEHLSCAVKLGHMVDLAALYVESADEKIKRAERFMSHKKSRIDGLRARGDESHKPICDLWAARYPELIENIDELKFKVEQHKKRS